MGTTILAGGEEEAIRRELFGLAMKGEWQKVVETYRNNPKAHESQITKSGDTVIQIAVTDGQQKIVEELVSIMVAARGKSGASSCLQIANEQGNTALHRAASMGNAKICECVAKVDPSTLLVARNNDNQTPFFLSALHGKVEAFLCLYNFCKDDKGDAYYRGKDGDTILHVSIAGEYFDLAFHIIHMYPELVNYVNEHGISPLHLLASKPTAFRSGSHISGFLKLIYSCTFVDELKVNKPPTGRQTSLADISRNNLKYPDNYETCINIIWLFVKAAEVLVMKLSRGIGRTQEDTGRPRGDTETGNQSTNVNIAQGDQLVPPNCTSCFDLLKLVSKALLIILGLGSMEIRKLEQKKKNHIWSVQIMNELLNRTSMYEYDHTAGSNPEITAADHVTQPYAFRAGGHVAFDQNVEKHEQLQPTNIDHPKQRNPSMGKDEEKQKGSDEMGIVQLQVLTPKRSGASGMVEKVLDFFSVEDMKLDKKNIVLMAMQEPKPIPLMAKKETPILIAAKNGIKEMVEKIIQRFPVAIHDMNSDGKNVVLLAVENRQPHVYEFLISLKRAIMKESIFHQVDSNGNSALHLAATLGDYKPWRIPGAALQMQWEFKWYKYVKNSMPRDFFVRHNNEGKTARDIFTNTHQELVKSGGEWLTNTSESCSVVAALIATVAFATSATVPGGVNEENGAPTLEGQPAFNVFAISSLVALCFSVTAVVMFLSILTSRYQEKDFGRDLPRKLLLGLSSLFVSIAAILVSFCAGHFFVLKDKLRIAALPIYAVTCLPVTLFAIMQFPLYFDLVWAFFKKVPQRSYMVVT
ncbi:hypothetical protein Tsubulata_048201 [Turnera subulata]|uniref:PGG domain-containing protein n=1 Tax=Turnera subulata TaxID=218843 RepID=A0A9Q0J851_9ROSI|nr:hypothetical protein Tsubulata_048201 [Turnera subulata]